MKTSCVPVSKKWLVDGFCWYSQGLVSKRFSSFGIHNAEKLSGLAASSNPVFYLNHIGWWDPIVGMLIRQWAMPDRRFYAPIDSVQLENYRILKKMGFFGVAIGSSKGAADFLQISREILQSAGASLWITPEGKFCDVRDHSASLMPGLSHLASKLPSTPFVPMAIEYSFWSDAQPHIFCCVGDPIVFSHSNPENSAITSLSKPLLNEQLTQGLRSTQDRLAGLVVARDASAFDYIVASKAKRLSWYDFARDCAARWSGRKFDPRHSAGANNKELH